MKNNNRKGKGTIRFRANVDFHPPLSIETFFGAMPGEMLNNKLIKRLNGRAGTTSKDKLVLSRSELPTVSEQYLEF